MYEIQVYISTAIAVIYLVSGDFETALVIVISAVAWAILDAAQAIRDKK